MGAGLVMPTLAPATDAPTPVVSVPQPRTAPGAAWDRALCVDVSLALIDRDDRCMILGPDRKPIKEPGSLRPLRLPLREAVEQADVGRTPMALPAADVIALDVDSTDSPDALDQLRVFREQANRLGVIEPVETASGRDQHRHVWLVVEDAAHRERLITLARALGLSVRCDQPMRLPLAPYYDDSGTVRLLSPATTDAARHAVLREGPVPRRPVKVPAQPVPQRRPSAPTPKPLGKKQQKALLEGHKAAGYETRHGADQGVATSAYSLGWTFDQFAALYERPEHAPGASKYRELGPGGLAYLQRNWRTAETTVAHSAPVADAQDVVALLSDWRITARYSPWPNRGGPADQALYLALLEAGLTAPQPTVTPAFSRYDMCEALGKSKSTAEQALSRLRKAGAVTEEEKGDTSNRSRWRLRPPPQANSNGQNRGSLTALTTSGHAR